MEAQQVIFDCNGERGRRKGAAKIPASALGSWEKVDRKQGFDFG
jgi:hypothetical protein